MPPLEREKRIYHITPQPRVQHNNLKLEEVAKYSLDLLISCDKQQTINIADTLLIQLSFFEHRKYAMAGKIFHSSAPLARAYFSPHDIHFHNPLGILGMRDPKEALCLYAEQSGRYHAQSGYLTTVLLKYFPSQKLSEVIGKYHPEDILKNKVESHPEIFFI